MGQSRALTLAPTRVSASDEAGRCHTRRNGGDNYRLSPKLRLSLSSSVAMFGTSTAGLPTCSRGGIAPQPCIHSLSIRSGQARQLNRAPSGLPHGLISAGGPAQLTFKKL